VALAKIKLIPSASIDHTPLMPVTPEELLKDPTILLNKKGDPLDSTYPLHGFEGKVGAVVFNGASFVTSPNMDYIFAPPNNARMTIKRDLRLGDDDNLLWPQPYFEHSPHFAAIPRKPEDYSIGHRHYICFYVTTDTDFVCREVGPVSGLGHLHPKLLKLANQLYSHLDRLHDIYQIDLSFPKKTHFFSHLLASIKRSLVHLKCLPMTRREMRFIFAEMQRCMLEFIGGHDYIYIYKPRMDGEKPPATTVAHTIGAFVQSSVSGRLWH